MFNSTKFLARRLFPACVLAISFILIFGSLAPIMAENRQTQVLTLDAGNGKTAQLSNYSLTNASFSNSLYQGTFCFTLTNTSQSTFNSAPPDIIAIGLQRDQSNYAFSDSSNQKFIVSDSLTVVTDDGFDFSAILEARDVDGIPSGIPISGSESFCVTVTSSSPITLDNLIRKFAIVFQTEFLKRLGFCFTGQENKASLSRASFYVTTLTASQFCFTLENLGNQIITGIGFDLPQERGPFTLLSVNPLPQANNQNFYFSTSPGKVTGYNRNTGSLDFGFLTGQNISGGIPKFGISPLGVSSNFCVNGNFSGLTANDIASGTIIRFRSDWSTEFRLGDCFGSTGGVKGVVASNPL
jgi:uncharacterized protein YjbI with pentapeptide repeats